MGWCNFWLERAGLPVLSDLSDFGNGAHDTTATTAATATSATTHQEDGANLPLCCATDGCGHRRGALFSAGDFVGEAGAGHQFHQGSRRQPRILLCVHEARKRAPSPHHPATGYLRTPPSIQNNQHKTISLGSLLITLLFFHAPDIHDGKLTSVFALIWALVVYYGIIRPLSYEEATPSGTHLASLCHVNHFFLAHALLLDAVNR